MVLLDPARGGAESGPRIADRTPEKQVTLDLAGRLASLLRARGFTVALTRDADTDVTSDARAAMANNLHPIACILLHATPSGRGVHLYTTSLHQKVVPSGFPVRWDEAQAAYTDRSRSLANDVKLALQHSKVAASSGQTWLRPLDNMQCPAVAVEVAPQREGNGAENNSYQALISNALANTLLQWRGKVGSMAPPEPQPAPAEIKNRNTAIGSSDAAVKATLPSKNTPKPATPASRLPPLDPMAPDRTEP